MGTGNQVIRIGFVGAGAIARHRHLPALQAIDGVQLAVVCNQHRESAEAVAADYSIPEVVSEWQQVVSRPDVDVVWIGTTPHLHAPVTIAALQNGKHVFCQARMAMNLSDANFMLAAAEAHPSQVTMLCPPPTGMKHGLYFEKLLREHAIGRIYHFRLRALTAQWADISAPAHWRQRRELSGNHILSAGIYAEVLGRFFGDPLSLLAHGRVFHENRQGYTVEIPDYLQVLGEWPDHVAATLEWSGVARHGGSEELEVFGSEGKLVYNFSTDEILLGRTGDSRPNPVSVPAEFTRTWTVEQDFIQAVRQRTRPEPSFQTGVRYMAFVEAVQRSMAEQSWVPVPEDGRPAVAAVR